MHVRQPTEPGYMRGDGKLRLTVGDLRNAIALLDDDVKVSFGGTIMGGRLLFSQFDMHGDEMLLIELIEEAFVHNPPPPSEAP